MQWLVTILGATLLTACTQGHLATNKSEIVSPSRQAYKEYNGAISFAPKRRVAVARNGTDFAPNKNAAATQVASHGVASFYTEGTETASGEKFNTHE